MIKRTHEVRDPIHVFIRYDSHERKVIDSQPFQRLRHIHQLAMTYLVYPGATHRRFEHSLGTMELATKIFDIVTRPENLHHLPDDVLEKLPDLSDQSRRGYWRQTLRLAALCHDLGHLPFSHAAEELLPEGVSHEVMTARIIMDVMQNIWSDFEKPKPEPECIARIAIGTKELAKLAQHHPEEAKQIGQLDSWQEILSQIIVGDVFGADRMDYLLRDSHHAGVTYGHFDHHRLIDTMRILPGPPADSSQAYNPEPMLGIEIGGLQVAESLLVARYLMFSQVYFHHVRRVYDLHLKEFLLENLDGGQYPDNPNELIKLTDNEILARIQSVASDPSMPGHQSAQRIYKRKHFKKIFTALDHDIKNDPFILKDKVYKGLCEILEPSDILIDNYAKGTALKHESDFPVLRDEKIDRGKFVSAAGESKVLGSLPSATARFVFVNPDVRSKACDWVEKKLSGELATNEGEKNA